MRVSRLSVGASIRVNDSLADHKSRFFAEISKLKERGNTNAEIAKKTDLNVTYVGGILKLLAKGEDRLLQAVEKGQIPVSIAVIIA